MPISQHESAIILEPCRARPFLEVNIWGLAYYAVPIGERRREYTGIHAPGFIGHLLVFLRHAYRLFQSVGYARPLHVEMLLENIRGVPWISIPAGLFAETGPCSELDNSIAFQIDATIDGLEEHNRELVKNLLTCVFFAINWPRVADNAEKLEALVAEGYYHNSWGPRPRTA